MYCFIQKNEGHPEKILFKILISENLEFYINERLFFSVFLIFNRFIEYAYPFPQH